MPNPKHLKLPLSCALNLEMLNDVCQVETYAADSIVIAEGTRKDNFYIIQDDSDFQRQLCEYLKIPQP
ncbi:MAG: hypothetical protein ABFS43_06355 [Thermodesulfobacteriota bacterium]